MADPQIGEFELIRRIRRSLAIPPSKGSSVVVGIGDDAAVLKPRAGYVLLATTDLLAECIHFDLSYTTYRQLGYKALMVNLSDLAAMGGIPRHVLIALALTARETVHDVQALYAGIQSACRPTGAVVVGGDTSASQTGLFLSVTVLGEAKPREVLFRSGAHVGDRIYVTGTLGDARAGLEILTTRRGGTKRGTRPVRNTSFLIARHLAPSARLKEARLLAEGGLASAAIDLSDGLAGDLRHICEESGVGSVIEAGRLPISPALIAYARTRHRDPTEYALSGGEDYELLFTVPPRSVPRVNTLIRQGRLRATDIGAITPKRFGLRIAGADGSVRPLRAGSYEHVIGKRRRPEPQ
jgi:thiamine-monophosphate kinase